MSTSNESPGSRAPKRDQKQPSRHPFKFWKQRKDHDQGHEEEPDKPAAGSLANKGAEPPLKPAPAAVEPSAPQQPSKEEDVENIADISFALWDKAYTSLRNGEKKKLVLEYEERLTIYGFGPSSTKNAFDGLSGKERVEMMEKVTDKSLEKAQKRPKVERAVETTVKLIDFAKEQVGSMLKDYPPAALAWSGFCTLTPFLLKPIKENKKMHEGLEYIIRRMKFSMGLVRLVLRNSWKNDKQFLELRGVVSERIQSLYQKMLQYEMSVVNAVHSYWTVARNLVSWDGWEDQVKSIKEAEEEVDGITQKYGLAEITEHLRESTVKLGAIELELANANRRKITHEQNVIIGKFSVDRYMDKNPVELNSRRIPGTCQWFLNDTRYHEWLTRKDVSILLVTAPPGCGKSVLAGYLIEEELRVQWPDEQICYYFFGRQQEQRNITTTMRALLYQFLSAHPDIVDDIGGDVIKAADDLVLFEKLSSIFTKAVQNEKAAQVICVLDGLDECEIGEVDKLFKWLRSLSSSGDGPTIKFLLTSQGLPHILKNFESSDEECRHISTEDELLNEILQKEIEVVMESRFSQFSKKVQLDLQPQKRQSLWQSMQEASRGQRTYLWLKLVFDALERSNMKSKKAWEEIIRSLPLTIVAAYDKLFKFIEPDDEPRVRLLLHLMYAASTSRPLTLWEAQMAITVHLSEEEVIKSEEELDDEMELMGYFRDFILRACGFFVCIYDDRLFFIHQTARNYLSLSQGELEKARCGKNNTPGDADAGHSFGGFLTERAAHAVAAECCIAYLSISEHAEYPEQTKDMGKDKSTSPSMVHDVEVEKLDDGAPATQSLGSGPRFLDYSIEYWASHFRLSQEFSGEGNEATVHDIDERFAKRYLNLWNLASGNVQPMIARSLHSTSWTYEPLSASVGAGQAKLLLHHLANTRDHSQVFSKQYPMKESDPDFYNHPLPHVACWKNHTSLVRLMLDVGASVEANSWMNPNLNQKLLHIAVRQQNPEMVKMLLERGAEVDSEDLAHGGTPFALDLQLSYGCASILLEHGASWKTALDYLRVMRPGRAFGETISALHKSEFATLPDFVEAARELGYAPKQESEQHDSNSDSNDSSDDWAGPYGRKPRRGRRWQPSYTMTQVTVDWDGRTTETYMGRY